jgi:hypothetical protein
MFAPDILDRVIAGRQYLFTGILPYFDGLTLQTKEFEDLKDLQFSLFGGVPTHLYESSASGDWVVGSGIQVRPTGATKLKVDWEHVEDESSAELPGGFKVGDHHNDLLVLGVWQNVTDNIDVHGRYTFIEKKERDAFLRSSLTIPDADFYIQASYFRQLETLKDFAIEFNPYFTSLKEYFPYHQYDINFYKGIGCVMISGGTTVRDLVDEGDEGPYNHEFRRYYVTPSIRNFPLKESEASVTMDIWDSPDDDIRTFGAELKHSFDKRTKISCGTYYSLFKYDYYSDTERDDVRTAFVKVQYKLRKDLNCQVKYELEDADFDSYQ